MEIITSSLVDEVLREIQEAANGSRKQRIAGWIAALKAAEAKAIAAKDPARLYQANYRVRTPVSAAKGSADERRRALVEILQALAPKERHQSTSTWIFQLHIPSAGDVATLLAPPLDTALDFLAVSEVTGNRATVGAAKLES